MSRSPLLAAVLWIAVLTWLTDDVDDEPVVAARPSPSRMRRIRADDYGTRMSLLNDYKHGSERKRLSVEDE